MTSFEAECLGGRGVAPTRETAPRDFRVRGLGFFELFGVPGAILYLRRSAFQDALRVPAVSVPEPPPATSFGFRGALSQIEPLAEACRASRPNSVDGPRGPPGAPAM
ncbi:hypothetical protein [Streptomyces sp. NBC_01685]|uniref:hypothetical protein n=1 Tax=Streptomyces sp. NBC_01685 TaxID=2975910 RepID=UPI003FCD05A1